MLLYGVAVLFEIAYRHRRVSSGQQQDGLGVREEQDRPQLHPPRQRKGRRQVHRGGHQARHQLGTQRMCSLIGWFK